MATRSEDYYKEDDEDRYNYKKTIIIEDGEMKTVEKTRKMKIVKKKIIVKMRKIYNFMYNYDVDYNDECEDIGKVRQMKIGQEDEENED